MESESKTKVKRHLKILTDLAAIAAQSEKFGGQRVAAAITHKNEIIAVANNIEKTHPLQARFGKNEFAIFLHAEINAIRKALTRISADDLKNCTLYINRLDQYNHWTSSNPCKHCLNAIKSFNIGKVIVGMPDFKFCNI